MDSGSPTVNFYGGASMSVIFGMSQVIGVVSADQGTESFVSRWVVVPDVELLRITFLGGYFSLLRAV